MAFPLLADRVRETSTTTGTGTYDLSGAVTGYQTFVAGIGDANTCYYCATDGTDWEVGVGTVTDAATDTLARTTILKSSNSDAAVNWSAGTRDIFVTLSADAASIVPVVDSRTNLKLVPTAIEQVRLNEAGREGWFKWDSSVLIATHVADTQEGIYVAPDAGSNGAWVRQYDGPMRPDWFGADTNASDNSTELDAMYDAGADSVEYDAFYPVTGNFYRPNIPHHGTGGVTISSINIPLNNQESQGAVTVYVDKDASDTANHGLTSANAFRTLQRAFDSLPATIHHQMTIVLSDETHTENYADETDKVAMPRAAVLFARGKNVSPRTQNNSGTMTGSVVIKSAGGNADNCIIETSATYDYGVYVAHGQIVFDEITIRAGATATALLVAHRSTAYVHAFNCKLNDNSQTVTSMLIAESGGMVEFTGGDWEIDGGSTGLQALVKGSMINLSGDGVVKNNTTAFSGDGYLNCVRSTGATGNMFESSTNGLVGYNAEMRFRGQSASVRLQVDVPVSGENNRIHATWTDFEDSINPENSQIYLNASNFQAQITLKNTNLFLDGVNSYVSPATANDSSTPIRNENGWIGYAGTNNIVGASSGRPTRPVTTFTAAGNSETYTPDPSVDVYQMNGGGAARTGGTLGVDSADFTGRIIHLIGYTWSIEINDSSTCEVPGSAVVFGNGSGQYAGGTFILRSTGKWHMVNGVANP